MMKGLQWRATLIRLRFRTSRAIAVHGRASYFRSFSPWSKNPTGGECAVPANALRSFCNEGPSRSQMAPTQRRKKPPDMPTGRAAGLRVGERAAGRMAGRCLNPAKVLRPASSNGKPPLLRERGLFGRPASMVPHITGLAVPAMVAANTKAGCGGSTIGLLSAMFDEARLHRGGRPIDALAGRRGSQPDRERR